MKRTNLDSKLVPVGLIFLVARENSHGCYANFSISFCFETNESGLKTGTSRGSFFSSVLTFLLLTLSMILPTGYS